MDPAPYNTPAALGREPFTAAFWTLCAPILFPVAGTAIAGLIWPGFYETIRDPAAAGKTVGLVWMILLWAHAAHFAILSLWSERVGAGPFAGSVRASQNWLLAAVLLGPPILILPNFAASILFGGAEGWEYSTDVNEALFTPSNWGPAYIGFSLLLAPLVEEMTFRGVALGAMIARGVPAGMAAALSSAAFTLFHLQYSVPALVVVFVAGLGFSWLRLASGTIIVPILGHMAANATVLFVASLSPPAG